ncbi:MAG: hypothetical protein LBQ22_08355 [Bacteroidales bacterium]|nr:hypothetical protein [Bacteroidales bacterium]
MKKIISFLVFVALFSLAFVSCDDDKTIEDLTGSMNVTVDGTNDNFSAVYFQYTGNKTIISSGKINITLDGQTTGEYTLGLGKNATSAATGIISGGISAITSGNTLVYTSTASLAATQTSVYGTLTITEASNDKLEGTFSTTVTELSNLTDLNLESILAILRGSESSTIEGSFKAVSYSN